MTGTIPHNAIAVNLTTTLKITFEAVPVVVFMADAKLGVSKLGHFTLMSL